MTNKTKNIDQSIVENIKTIIDSPSPYKFISNLFKFQNEIQEFLQQAVGKIQAIDQLDEKDLQTQVMANLHDSNYHKTWLDFTQGYILASQKWCDQLYMDAYLYANDLANYKDQAKYDRHKGLEVSLSKKDLQTLSFNQVKRLISTIGRSLLSDNQTQRIPTKIQKQIDQTVQDYPANKHKIYNQVRTILSQNSIKQNKGLYRRYFKTQIIKTHFPSCLKALYWQVNNLPLDRNEYVQIKQNIDISDIQTEDLSNLKNLITQIDGVLFAAIFKPIILHQMTNSINIDIYSDRWQKTKYFLLFYLSNNYLEYQKIKKFVCELESFLDKKPLNQLKIWGFWFITLPILTILAGLFLPIGVFVPIVGFLGHKIYKIFKSIKAHTEYKIRFNLGINLVATLSISGFLTASVFLTDLESYKSGYQKIKPFINAMSAVSPADILSASPQGADISSGSDSNQLTSKLQRDYLADGQKNSKTQFIKKDLETTDSQDKVSNDSANSIAIIDSQADTVSEASCKYYFSGTVQLGNGIYLWNLIDKIVTRYEIDHDYQISNLQKRILIRQIAKDYTIMNIDKFKSSSISQISDKLHWNELNRRIPQGFEVKMSDIEKVVVHQLRQFK